ncbi:hypothetical protein ACVIW0_001876 [Bradyrhizobium sp. USDA 4454]
MIVAVDDQRLQHRFGIGGVDEVGQIFGRPAGRGLRPFHLDADARRRALAVGDLRIGLRHFGDVGVVAEPWIVACHQDAILGQMQVLFERVGAEVGGELVRGFSLLGHQARHAAMPDHQRQLAVDGQERFCA